MDMMSLRRRIMGAEKTLLPSAYQQVEYLESTGTQYIDLPFGFWKTDEVRMVASETHNSTDKYMISPSVWNNSNNRFCMAGEYTNGYFAVGLGNKGTSQGRSNVLNDNNIHTWTYSNSLFRIEDLDVTINVGSYIFILETTNLRLFYGYQSPTKGQIASYWHRKLDGTEVNLIPCYRKADQKPGMYDLVSGTFYTNSGTGEFVVGADV